DISRQSFLMRRGALIESIWYHLDMIKAVIFDVGGVLHTNEMKFVHQDIISTLGITKSTFECKYNELIQPFSKGEISEKQFWDLFLKATNTNKSLPDVSLFVREFEKRYQVNHDVINLVKSLKRGGFKLAILSNTIKPHVEVNKKMGIYENFPTRVLSNEVGLTKPDSRIFTLILDRLKTKPQEAVFIDDKEEFVRAAEDFGLKGILFKNTKRLKKDLQFLGIKVEGLA
ncbi:MAG TPA: HAD family phosphatase, partial [Candidatus Nanoarchaeia archaeon]